MSHRIYNPLESRDLQLQSRRSSGRVSPQGESGGRTYTGSAAASYQRRHPVHGPTLRAELIEAGLLVPANTLTPTPLADRPVLRIGAPVWMHEVRFAERSYYTQQDRARGGR